MKGEEWRDRGEKREGGREEGWEGGTMDTPNFSDVTASLPLRSSLPRVVDADDEEDESLIAIARI